MATTATTPTTGTTDIDPITGLPKVKSTTAAGTNGIPESTVPTTDPNKPNASVKLSDAALAGAAAPIAPVTDTAKGNTDVLGTAQSMVLNQPGTSTLQSSLDQSAQNWVNNPMGGYDPAAAKTAAMDKSNNDWAKSFESMRQQYGNTSGSGLLQQNMLQNALQHNVDNQTLSSQMDTDAYNKYVDSLGKSLAAGQSQNAQDQNVFSQRLQNLSNVRGMAEGEAGRTQQTAQSSLDRAQQLLLQSNDQTGQQALANLNGKIASNAQLTQNDFTQAQSALDRQLKVAMQSNDLQGQKDIQAAQADLQTKLQASQQTFTASQSSLDRAQQLLVQTNDQQGQKDLAELQGKIQSGQMLTANDFKASQSALDRAQQLAIQNNDINAQHAILDQKAALDMQAQKAQNDFVAGQNTLANSWKTNERISTQDYNTAMAVFDQQNKLAIQNNDIVAQKNLADSKAYLDLNMQTNQMNETEKLTYINAQIADAKANGDLNRAQQLSQFQTGQDIAKMKQSLSNDEVMAQLNNGFAQALQNNDFTHANALQNARIQEQQTEFAANDKINQAELVLKQQGFTAAQIQAAVDAGEADPSSMTKFLKSAGIDTTPPDPNAASIAAAKKQNDMQLQYGLTHPEALQVVDSKGNVVDPNQLKMGNISATDILKDPNNAKYGGLSVKVADSALKDYDNLVNQTLYNEKTGQSSATKLAQASPSDLQGADKPDSPYYKDYQAALKTATTFDAASKREGGSGLWQNHTDKFSNPIPSIGVSFKGKDGKLYIANSGISQDKSDGNGTEYFYALDPATGNTMKVSAANGGTYTTWQSAIKQSLQDSPITDPTGIKFSTDIGNNVGG